MSYTPGRRAESHDIEVFIAHVNHSAAELAPEWAWQEADFVRNVVVRDNVIDTNGTGIWLGIDPWHWKGPPGPTK